MKITYYGHSAFVLELDGKSIAIDPFITGNPICPLEDIAELGKIDYVLLTHAHADHLGDTLDICKAHSPKVFAIFELATWLESQGVKNCTPMNVGGTLDAGDFELTMTRAYHSNSIQLEDGSLISGGDPAGFVIKAEGQSLYFAGDTDVFSDMALINEFHKPTIGILPIGDHFTMGVKGAAYACNNFFDFETIIPMHHSTFDLLTGTPDDFAKHVQKGKVLPMKPLEEAYF